MFTPIILEFVLFLPRTNFVPGKEVEEEEK